MLPPCTHRYSLVSFDLPGDVKVVYEKFRHISAKIDVVRISLTK
jgi:hypothetical protein